MCPHCADGSGPLHARRARILHLLALIEHPDALPPEDALRIAGELLAWAGRGEFTCAPVAMPAGAVAA
ncbi:hypothetical protein [Acidocella sp.]|uniref:hypothetical protein n=1 Tax=Acidocella sp. TaxID=50710 RepID=UPI00261161B5|nr:hypothetical protein [Acidocella sp.]